MSPDPHLKLYSAGGSLRLRLICFPYAGGSAGIFRDWVRHLPPGVEVCAVQLPGRAERWNEPPYLDIDQLINVLCDVLRPLTGGRFALFGYSAGAQLAFEIARIFERTGVRTDCLFAAAHRAPHLPAKGSSLHALPESAFFEEISRRFGPIDPAILEEDEMRQIFLAPLRADIKLAEMYRFAPSERLRCPISVFEGLDDASVSHEEMTAWSMHTTSSFELRQLPGGHFFLRTSLRPLLEAISQDLRSYSVAD